MVITIIFIVIVIGFILINIILIIGFNSKG